ncbi:RNA-directed DNA polymerase, eukaryota [Tanacetum coccineum]|uniref:RNA-directed DNA polymerase, eukaryota n=1 Tax=Tanacetum coccineum TaxID=301880 RepID=A0ABQ5H001_9ASTR
MKRRGAMWWRSNQTRVLAVLDENEARGEVRVVEWGGDGRGYIGGAKFACSSLSKTTRRKPGRYAKRLKELVALLSILVYIGHQLRKRIRILQMEIGILIQIRKDREIMRVLVECCLQEKVFNNYHCVLASKLCSHATSSRYRYVTFAAIAVGISLPEYAVAPELFAEKLDAPISALSFRREVRGGIEQQQWSKLVELVGSVSLSSSPDRWFCDLSGDGVFTVKVVRNFLDDMLLPSHPVVTSWTKFIPIKVNIFAWRARRDCLPTRYNLSRRGVVLDSIVCPICGGIWIGWRFLPLRIGMFGSPQSVYRLLLNLCWKESLALLGGGFGRFAIGLFLITLLPGGRWSLMKLFRILLIGFPIDVIGLSLGLFG